MKHIFCFIFIFYTYLTAQDISGLSGVRGGSDFIKDVQSLSQVLKQRREVYHQPSDTVAYWWNFDATAQQARIVFLCEYETANQNITPYWYRNQEFTRTK